MIYTITIASLEIPYTTHCVLSWPPFRFMKQISDLQSRPVSTLTANLTIRKSVLYLNLHTLGRSHPAKAKGQS